jgi:hypothetical protein
MYLLGLRALGHEVFYIEDTGECVYDPVQNTRAIEPTYGTNYIQAALAPYGLGDRWAFVNYDGSYHGRSVEDVRRYAAGCDLFINLSGGSWFWRDEYAASLTRCSSTPIRRSRNWRLRRPSRGMWRSSSGSIIYSPSARTSARRPRRFQSATSRGTRPGSRSHSTTGCRTSSRAIDSRPS